MDQWISVITIITPLHRPEDAPNAFRNASRQKDVRLVIIENGEGVGACKRYNLTPNVLLTSEPHQSYARNAGLNWLRKRGGGFFVMMDGDDYYGPGYVDKMVEASKHGDVIGQASMFVRMTEGDLCLFRGAEDREVPSVMGSTISGNAEIVPDYRHPGENSWEDDTCFNADCRDLGLKIWATSPRYHVYRRHGSNIWKGSDAWLSSLMQMRAGPGNSYSFCSAPDEIANADPDGELGGIPFDSTFQFLTESLLNG